MGLSVVYGEPLHYLREPGHYTAWGNPTDGYDMVRDRDVTTDEKTRTKSALERAIAICPGQKRLDQVIELAALLREEPGHAYWTVDVESVRALLALSL